MGKITLKAARINAGLTQEELANAMGVRPATIGSWERGDTLPDILQAEKLGEICDVHYDNIAWNVKNFKN